ncbi:hypothetical protein Ancab_028235 [Ancistrocladus abbreviatus]
MAVTEEMMGAAHRMGEFERDTGGNTNTDSSPSISLSFVSDSFGPASSGEHIPGVPISSPMIVRDSNRKLENEVMKVAIDREDRGNDVSVSVPAGTAELPLEVTARCGSRGILEQHKGGKGLWALGWPAFSEGCAFDGPSGLRGVHCVGFPCKAQYPGLQIALGGCGPGRRDGEKDKLHGIQKLACGLCSSSIGASQHNNISNFRRKPKKKHLEDILQLRLSKRVSGKSKKSRKKAISKLDREVSGDIIESFSCGESIHDSNIMNRNEIILAGTETIEGGKVGLSPSEICGFLSKLGMVQESNVEETVRRIAEMEERDALLFSSVVQPQPADKDEVSKKIL